MAKYWMIKSGFLLFFFFSQTLIGQIENTSQVVFEGSIVENSSLNNNFQFTPPFLKETYLLTIENLTNEKLSYSIYKVDNTKEPRFSHGLLSWGEIEPNSFLKIEQKLFLPLSINVNIENDSSWFDALFCHKKTKKHFGTCAKLKIYRLFAQ